MKTQISRDAYQSARRYSGVYQQQGRMWTDADLNLLTEIVKRRLDEALVDVIGSGAPRGRGLGVVPQGTGFGFQGNHLYADGVHAQVAPARLRVPFAYDNQADFPDPPPLPSSSFVLYADVWERTVVSLEDAEVWTADHLRDPALHGADTTTRTQTMAQIKFSDQGDPADQALNPRQGDATLTVQLRAGGPSKKDPCDPCAELVAVTLKWSSENGAEQVIVERDNLGKAKPVPPDFTNGDFVYEFFDGRAEKHLGVHLVPRSDLFPVRGQLFETYPKTPPADFDRVRRWDGYAVLQRSNAGAWSLAMEDGVVRGKDRETRLEARTDRDNPGDVHLGIERLVFHLQELTLDLLVQNRLFVAGDYWLAPVRESVHALGEPVLRESPPLGILHHYLRLAEIGANGQLTALSTNQDQQLHFPPLTELTAGDVDYGVTTCQTGLFSPPEAFDTVKKALDRLCTLAASDILFTESCNTSLYYGATVHTVADALHLLCDIEARHVEYAPSGPCTLFQGSDTVQKALDRLCTLAAADIAFTEACNTSLFAGTAVHTVAEALHLLCHIRAGHVEYAPSGPCTLFQGSDTVQKALDRLCTLGAANIAFTPPNNCNLFQEPAVTTVEQALARVCGIAAENVAYSGCTNLDPSIKTVKGALDAICSRPSGGGGCQVTVGIGGEFRTLAEALERSLTAGKTDLCFCLLPGKNPVDGPLSVNSSVTHFTLSGCGLGSALIVSANLTFSGVLSVRFEDLNLAISPDRQIVIEGGDEVALERVLVSGPPRDLDSPPPVTLNAAQSIRVAESELRFWLYEGITHIADLFSSVTVGKALINLFNQRLDEDFEAARSKEATRLSRLKPQDRNKIAEATSSTIDRKSTFSEQESRRLSRFADLLRAPTASATALAQSLGDIRETASRSNPALALVLIPGPAADDAAFERLLRISEILSPVDRGLPELFAERFDVTFEILNIQVALGLAFLPQDERSKVAGSIAGTDERWSVLSDQERQTLVRLIQVLGTETEPDTATIATSLGDIRTAAIESAPALPSVVGPERSGDTTLVDNRILGLVSVYGPPGTQDLTGDEMRVLENRFRERQITIVPAAGRLSVVRNEASRLILADRLMQQLKTLAAFGVIKDRPLGGGEVRGVYRAAFLAQNRLIAGRSRILAKDARLTDNIFEPVDVDADLGATIADTATYVGNGAVESDAFLFFNVTRRHNEQTKSDLNTMVII